MMYRINPLLSSARRALLFHVHLGASYGSSTLATANSKENLDLWDWIHMYRVLLRDIRKLLGTYVFKRKYMLKFYTPS